MAVSIESLEARLFLSSTPAPVIALKAEAAVLKADVKAIGAGDKNGLKTLKSDVKEAGLGKTDKALGKTLVNEGTAAFKLLGKALKTGGSLIAKDVGRLLSDEKKLAKKPGNSILEAKASADKSKLSSDAAAALAVVDSAATALHTTDTNNLDAIAATAPTDTAVQSDVASLIAAEGTLVQTLKNDASTFFTNDVNAVINFF